MWWHDKGRFLPGSPTRSRVGRGQAPPCPTLSPGPKLMRAIAVLAIAALAGGCFQPLYGEQSAAGGPILRDQLSAADVQQIQAPKGTDEARIAVEIRNAPLYDFTASGDAAPPTHRLKIAMTSTRASIIVDPNTSRPDDAN